MNHLDFAIHRYEELVSLSGEQVARQDIGWEDWLRDDVLPAIETSLLRPRFQDRARWPLETLRPDAETPERRTIEQFQSQLKSLAEVLTEVIRNAPPADPSQQLAEVSVGPDLQAAIGTMPALDDRTRRRLEEPALFEMGVHQVLRMATDPPPQLIDPSNYLLPRPGLLEILDLQNPSAGNAPIVFDSDLLPIGNHLIRRLLKEVRSRYSVLLAVRIRILQELDGQAFERTESGRQLDHAWMEFDQLHQRLQQTFHPSDEMALTESCIACTQLYAAVHPSPDLTWLGLPEPLIASGIAGLNQCLQRYWGPEIRHRIVTHLDNLRRLPTTAGTALEEAIATGGLVINQRAGTAFWRGQEIEGLTPAPYRFLVALGRAARQHRAMGARDISDEEVVSDSVMSTRWNRLKNRLPTELRSLVIPGTDRGTYRMTLPADQIHLIGR